MAVVAVLVVEGVELCLVFDSFGDGGEVEGFGEVEEALDDGRQLSTLMLIRGRSNNLWWGTALEAPDPHALASFYSNLLDWPVVHIETDTAVVKPPQPGVFMVFHRADDYVRPVWPPAPGDQRPMMHLDVEVDDLEASTADALAMGATLSDFQPRDNVRVLFDPAGHPFCLCLDKSD